MHPQNLKVVFWTLRDRGHTVDEISACLKVSRATLFRWKAHPASPEAEKGASQARCSSWGAHEKFQQEPTISLGQAASWLRQVRGVRASLSTLSRFCRRTRLTHKKATRQFSEASETCVANFIAQARASLGPQLYALDEAAFLCNHVKGYASSVAFKATLQASKAWSQKGARAVVQRPGTRGKAHSLLLCNSSAGVLSHTFEEGAITARLFADFLTRVPHDAQVVLDNARIHHATNVLRRQGLPTVPEVAARRGLTMSYLPPYAPKANPVELCFNTIKSHVKREQPRNTNSLAKCVDAAIQRLMPQICASTMRKVWEV